ncbi:MAG: helix-turn-helix domain-containing protein [Gemmatimonadetes bacterium]|nr:helix-turn-helix domain-containing protein [Gemmatimonadota bacterium]
MEILGASHRYDKEFLRRVSGTSVWLSLQEAAESVGLSPDTLRTQVNAGRLRAEKKGGVWLTTADWFRNYLASRKYNGKPVELDFEAGEPQQRRNSPRRRRMKK